MKALHHVFSVLLLALLPNMAAAQPESFTLSVNKNPVVVGDNFQVQMVLENLRGSINPPDFSAFQVLMGPSTSRNFQIINGQQSSKTTLSYVLRALEPGKYEIGPAVAVVNGKTWKTNTVTIEVLESGVSRPTRPNSAPAQVPEGANRELFLRIEPSRTTAWQGQEIAVGYVLYSRFTNLEMGELKLPTINGFWTEDVDLDRINWETGLESINGVPYRKAIVKQQLLYPQKSGKLTLESFSMSANVNRSFFNPGKEIQVSSEPITFTIKPFPEPRPLNFSGQTGSFRMEVTADRTTVQANEAINLKVTFTGNGNLKLINDPEIRFPTDFEVYDPQSSDRVSVRASGMVGTKTFEYLIIPRLPGEYEIPALEFTYFDAGQGTYKTLRSESLSIQVEKGTGAQGGASTYVPSSKTEVEVLERDIRFIETQSSKWRTPGEMFAGSPLFYALWILPFLLLMVLYGLQKQRIKNAQNAGAIRKRKASRFAVQRLKKAHEALNKGKESEFYQELFNALFGYLGDKIGVSSASVTRRMLADFLQSKQVPAELQGRLTATLDRCEMARFAPATDVKPQAVYDDTAQLITQLDNHL